MCRLSKALPDFPDPENPEGKRLNLRRLLLNKCQEEFEAGTAAIAAVSAREKQAEGQQEDKANGDKPEDGEITDEEVARRRKEKEDADRELQVCVPLHQLQVWVCVCGTLALAAGPGLCVWYPFTSCRPRVVCVVQQASQMKCMFGSVTCRRTVAWLHG